MWKDHLKNEWNKNPLQVIAVSGLAAGGIARLLDSIRYTIYYCAGRRAYAKQIDNRIKKG